MKQTREVVHAASQEGEGALEFGGPGVWTLPLTTGVAVQLQWVNTVSGFQPAPV